MEDKIMLKLVGSSLVLVGIFYKIFLSVPMNSDFENGLKAMTEASGSIHVNLQKNTSPSDLSHSLPKSKEVAAEAPDLQQNLEALAQEAESSSDSKAVATPEKAKDPKKEKEAQKTASKDPKKEKQEAEKKKKEEQKKKVAAQQQKIKQWYQAAYQNWANESALEQAREQRRQELAQEAEERVRQQSANISTAPKVSARTKPATTAADTSKYTAEEKRLRENLFQFPSISNMNKFIDLYLQQKIQDNVFYGTVKDLVLSPSKEHQRIGMYALNAYPSFSSFALLIEILDSSKDAELRSSLQSILLNYAQVSSQQVLLEALQHGKSRQVLVALDLSQRLLEKIQNQKDLSLGSASPFDKFLQVLSGQTQNPDANVAIKSQQVYGQFQQARTLWMASAAVHSGISGQP